MNICKIIGQQIVLENPQNQRTDDDNNNNNFFLNSIIIIIVSVILTKNFDCGFCVYKTHNFFSVTHYFIFY